MDSLPLGTLLYIAYGILVLFVSGIAYFVKGIITQVKELAELARKQEVRTSIIENRVIGRFDMVEQDLQKEKTKIAVIESKVDDMRNDIKDIKKNVEKLVERKL